MSWHHGDAHHPPCVGVTLGHFTTADATRAIWTIHAAVRARRPALPEDPRAARVLLNGEIAAEATRLAKERVR